MKQNHKIYTLDGRVDFLSLLLGLLVIFLISMLFAFLIFSRHVQHSIIVVKHVNNLMLSQSEFNNLKLFQSEFINFDYINATLNDFDNSLEVLKDRLGDISTDENELETLYEQIRAEFNLYNDEVEVLKTVYAATQNSFHQLLELQNVLNSDESIPSEIKVQISQVVIQLLNAFRVKFDDGAVVIFHLSVKELIDKDAIMHSPYLNKFNIHALSVLTFLEQFDLSKINKIDQKLNSQLVRFDELSSQYYEKNIALQGKITIVFFTLAFVLLGLIFLVYRRGVNAKKALQAFRYAVENSENTVVITTPTREIVYANGAFERATGYTLKEALGKNPSVLKSGKHDPKYYRDMNEILDRGEKWQGDFINKRKDGSLFSERASIIPVFLDDKLINYLAIKLDVTEYVEQNIKLQESASVLESIEEAIVVLDENLKVKNTKRAFVNLYGYCHNLCRNLTIHDLITDEYECQSLLNMLQDSNSGAKKTTVKLSNGESMVLWTTIKAIKGSDNEIVSYILLQTDIKEMIDLQKKTEYIAKHDPLTKLYNRLGYQDEFEKCLNDNKLFAVVFIDLDLFKQVNDS